MKLLRVHSQNEIIRLLHEGCKVYLHVCTDGQTLSPSLFKCGWGKCAFVLKPKTAPGTDTSK